MKGERELGGIKNTLRRKLHTMKEKKYTEEDLVRAYNDGRDSAFGGKKRALLNGALKGGTLDIYPTSKMRAGKQSELNRAVELFEMVDDFMMSHQLDTMSIITLVNIRKKYIMAHAIGGKNKNENLEDGKEQSKK